MFEAIKCACLLRCVPANLCPVCYGHGDVSKQAIPLKTSGEVLSIEMRWLLIQRAIAMSSPHSSNGAIEGRRLLANAAVITDQTLMRALKGGAISATVIRRLTQQVDRAENPVGHPIELRHGRWVPKGPERPANLRGVSPVIIGSAGLDSLPWSAAMDGFTIKATCPWCNQVAIRELARHNLVKPALGSPFDLILQCQSQECAGPTSGALRVRVRLDFYLSLTNDPSQAEEQ